MSTIPPVICEVRGDVAISKICSDFRRVKCYYISTMTAKTIIKFLTGSGAGSRRQMTAAIKAGRAALNGRIVESFTEPVTAADRVTLDGERLAQKTQGMLYVLLNKPKGIVSTTSDERGSKTVLDILPPKYRQARLYPVGRLDKESTGLILLTNDGDLTYRLTHPKFETEKEYLVQIDGHLTAEQKTRLESGVLLEEGKTSPAKVRAVNSPPFKYSITIHEGKKREVRRMFASLKHQVRELKRIRIDTLTIGGLQEGDTRELTPREIKALKSLKDA